MKIQLQNGTDKKTFRNKSIRRAYLEIVYSETNIANQGVDLSQCQIDVNLNQGGQPYSTSFQALPAFAKYLALDCQAPLLPTNFAPGVKVMRTMPIAYSAGVSSTNVCRIPIIEDPIILKNGDDLTITVQQLSGLYGSANVNTNQCYLVVEDGTDLIQEAVILPKYEAIVDSNTNPEFDLKMTSEIVLISGGASAYASVIPFNSATIRSTHYNDQFDNQQISTIPVTNQTYASTPVFKLFRSNGSKFLVNATLNLLVDTSKVTTGGDWVATKQINPNFVVAEDNKKRFRKIAQSKAKRLFIA